MESQGLSVTVLLMVLVSVFVICIPLIVIGVNWKHGRDIALKCGAWAGMIVSLVCSVFYIIPLAWVIPMTVIGKGVIESAVKPLPSGMGI